MKRYKLSEGIRFSSKGSIFQRKEIEIDGEKRIAYIKEDKPTIIIFEDELAKIANVKGLFQEFEEPKGYYYVTDFGNVGYVKDKNEEPNNTLSRLEIGNIFETQEEAEKYLGYLKAKEVIRKDTKGFETDWSDKRRNGYYFGTWNHYSEEPSADSYSRMRISSIKFKTREDIEKSFEKHPKEWKTYLTYEQ